jgi:hypothetical protein
LVPASSGSPTPTVAKPAAGAGEPGSRLEAAAPTPAAAAASSAPSGAPTMGVQQTEGGRHKHLETGWLTKQHAALDGLQQAFARQAAPRSPSLQQQEAQPSSQPAEEAGQSRVAATAGATAPEDVSHLAARVQLLVQLRDRITREQPSVTSSCPSPPKQAAGPSAASRGPAAPATAAAVVARPAVVAAAKQVGAMPAGEWHCVATLPATPPNPTPSRSAGAHAAEAAVAGAAEARRAGGGAAPCQACGRAGGPAEGQGGPQGEGEAGGAWAAAGRCVQ